MHIYKQNSTKLLNKLKTTLCLLNKQIDEKIVLKPIDEIVKLKIAPQWIIDTTTICVAVFTLISTCLGLVKLAMDVMEKCDRSNQPTNPPPPVNLVYFRLNVQIDDSTGNSNSVPIHTSPDSLLQREARIRHQSA
jgi:hypothetical protein